MPALSAPSPITAIAFPGESASLLAMAKPSAAEIEVELGAAPNGAYSLSARRVKPLGPPACRGGGIRARRPVGILGGISWGPRPPINLSVAGSNTKWGATGPPIPTQAEP